MFLVTVCYCQYNRTRVIILRIVDVSLNSFCCCSEEAFTMNENDGNFVFLLFEIVNPCNPIEIWPKTSARPEKHRVYTTVMTKCL